MAIISYAIVWLKTLLNDFLASYNQPAMLFCNNVTTFYIARNSVFHEKTNTY